MKENLKKNYRFPEANRTYSFFKYYNTKLHIYSKTNKLNSMLNMMN